MAGAQVQIRAVLITGRDAAAAPLPVRVELRNLGAAAQGALEWAIESRVAGELPLELPPNARKVVYLPLPYDAWREVDPYGRREGRARSLQPQLTWTEPERRPQQLPIEFEPANYLPLLIVGDVQGGFSRWSDARFALNYEFQGQTVDYQLGWRWQPVYLRPEELPEDFTVLLGVPALVLVEGAERLRPEQWDALLAWTLCGGHLIVSVGSLPIALQQTPLSALAPPIAERIQVRLQQPIDQMSLLQTAPPTQPVVLAQAQPDANWRSNFIGEHRIFSTRELGQGKLTLFWGDLTAEAWRVWKGMPLLASVWLNTPEPPILHLERLAPAPNLPPRLTPQQAITTTATLIAYIAILYGTRKHLRAQNRLRRASLIILWLALGASLGLSAFHAAAPATPHEQRHTIAQAGLPLRVELRRQTLDLRGGTHSIALAPDEQLAACEVLAGLEGHARVRYTTPIHLELHTPARATLRLLTVRVAKEADR